MFQKTGIVLVLLCSALTVESGEIPGNQSLAFATAGEVLESMKDFCSQNEVCIEEPVRIGAWNLQRLGVTKMAKSEVVDIIVKVVHNYDLVVLQEVTDSSGSVIPALLAATNENLSPEERYELIQSPRLGRTSYKEQYVYFYKPQRMSFVKAYQYNDTTDVFQFEPYVAHFNSTSMGPLTDFVVIPLHAKPSDAEKETDALADVYDDAVQRWGIADAFLLGDFNAGCNYIVQSEYEKIRLYTEPRFHWIISDHADTTTKTTSCPYDRIVLAGAQLQNAAYYKTASVYYFDEAFGIESNWDLVSDISDHYPVGVMIRGTVPSEVNSTYGSEAPLSAKVSVEVELAPSCWGAVHALAHGLPAAVCNTTSSASVVEPKILIAEWTKTGVTDAVGWVVQLSEEHPAAVSKQAVALLGYKAGHGALSDQTLYAPDRDLPEVTVALQCRDRNSTPLCSLALNVDTLVN